MERAIAEYTSALECRDFFTLARFHRAEIVIYFSDNGPNGYRWNDGMKGRKGSTDEGGVRSPLLMRWPGHVPAGKNVREIAAAIDLLPTLADLCGIEVAGQKQLDGESIKMVLSAEPYLWPDRMIFSHWNKKVSVRTQQYRLDHEGKLFDMRADPGQDNDVSKQHPELTKRLADGVAQYKRDVLTGYDNDPRPFLVGHPDYRYTQMPARDATAHGNIKRSNRFPNCSYFTNWTSVNDKLTWDAEVGATGDYEVELYYACPAADVGSTIELTFNDSKLSGQITAAHDPPLRGDEHDRVKRNESYVKDFKPMSLGTIHLQKGTGTLTLQATAMPGEQVMEFRLLMLTRAP